MEIAAGPLDSLLAQWLWKPNEKTFIRQMNTFLWSKYFLHVQ